MVMRIEIALGVSSIHISDKFPFFRFPFFRFPSFLDPKIWSLPKFFPCALWETAGPIRMKFSTEVSTNPENIALKFGPLCQRKGVKPPPNIACRWTSRFQASASVIHTDGRRYKGPEGDVL